MESSTINTSTFLVAGLTGTVTYDALTATLADDITLANKIGDSAIIKRLGGMERKAASLGQKSTAIVVQQNMLRLRPN